jgi:hypothetical protein
MNEPMELKSTDRIQHDRVIIEGTEGGVESNKMYFYAGWVVAMGGASVIIDVPEGGGVHAFDRETGVWLAGSCLNLLNATIRASDLRTRISACAFGEKNAEEPMGKKEEGPQIRSYV